MHDVTTEEEFDLDLDVEIVKHRTDISETAAVTGTCWVTCPMCLQQ
ncbi:hypothetical protein [Streptomyces chattanoogensis]|nr:hypothetical protein T261_8501 [Streptomyces lydicus]